MDPQNAVQDLPVILVRPPRPGLLRRQQRFQPLPVLVGQVSSSHGTEMGIQTRNVSRLQTRASAGWASALGSEQDSSEWLLALATWVMAGRRHGRDRTARAASSVLDRRPSRGWRSISLPEA